MANDIYFSDPPRTPAGGTDRAPAPARRAADSGRNGGAAQSGPAHRRKKKKKRRPARAFFRLLLLLILCAGALAGYAYFSVLSAYTPAVRQKSGSVDESALMHSSDVYNILLMGVDQAETDGSSRSDSMILLSVDSAHGQLKLTSFMRDMYVTVPGYGQTKLTHAHMYEGPSLTADTIELNFGVRIDAYAKIGYDFFIDLVNGVGGVTIDEIDETEARALAEEWVYVEPGKNIHLTGEQAIKYVRIRHWQSDFARTQRQRKTIGLIVEQAKKLPPTRLLALAKDLAGKIECTVPKAELASLALKTLPCLRGEILQQQIPADGTWEDGWRDSLMVLLVDFDANRQILKDFIYGG